MSCTIFKEESPSLNAIGVTPVKNILSSNVLVAVFQNIAEVLQHSLFGSDRGLVLTAFQT